VQLEDLEKDIVNLIRTIENDTVFEPKESGLCDWCEYPEYCPAKKHGLAVQNLPPNEYLAEAGVSLVNKFASIKARMKDLKEQEALLEAELDLIKEAAVQYARKNGITNILGSDFILKVVEESTLAFPRAEGEGRSDLEESVRKAGIWNDVSLLSLPRAGEGDQGREDRREFKRSSEYTRNQGTCIESMRPCRAITRHCRLALTP